MKKIESKGIQRLYSLRDNDGSMYQYGFFYDKETESCYFRIKFEEESFLYRLAIEPILNICADGKCYKFIGTRFFDDTGKIWDFNICDDDMRFIAQANTIEEIYISTTSSTSKEDILDLNKLESNVWSSFFAAGLAECVNHVENSRQLDEFFIQRFLSMERNKINALLRGYPNVIETLAAIALNPHKEEYASFFSNTDKLMP